MLKSSNKITYRNKIRGITTLFLLLFTYSLSQSHPSREFLADENQYNGSQIVNNRDINYAINFNDSLGHMRVDHDNSLNITESNGNQGSIMAWLNIDYSNIMQNDWPRIISKKTWWDEPTGYEIDVNPFTNKITLVAGNDNVAIGEFPHRNGWVHIAVTFSDSNATIYFNGNDVTIDDHIDPITSNIEDLWVGAPLNNSYSCCWMNGLIDDIAIFDVALTNTEILNYAANQLTGGESNLVAYWNFNQTNGDIAYDMSINDNHGQFSYASIDSSYNQYIIMGDDYAPILHHFSLSNTYFDVTSNPDDLDIFASFSDQGYGLLSLEFGIQNLNGNEYLNFSNYYNGTSDTSFNESITLDNNFSSGEYSVDYIRIIDMAGNSAEYESHYLDSLGYTSSFNLVSSDSSNSYNVTFRYYPQPGDDFFKIFIPGTMPPGWENDWGPSEGGVISQGAPSEMVYNESLNCFEKTYLLIEGEEHSYKFYFQYDSSGNNYSWENDPLNDQIDTNYYQNSFLTVTDPLFFQPIMLNSGQSSDVIFNLGIYGSGSVSSIVYSQNDQYEEATGWLSSDGLFSISSENISSIYDPFNIAVEIDGQSYDFYYQGENRPVNPASLEFDGGDWDDDYVSFGDILDMGENSFSYSTWVKFDTLNVDWAQTIISKGADGGTSPSDNGFKLFVPPNTNYVRAHISSSPSNDADVYTTPLDVDIWYYLTVVIDREVDFQVLYLNGLVQDSSDISHVAQINNNCHLHLGNNYWADTGQNAAVLDGKIFGFSYWDAAISFDQVNSLLNQSIMLSNNNRDDFLTIASDYGNLSAAWIFRDSSNTQLFNIIDESTYSGSIINAEWNTDIPSTQCGQGLVSGPNAQCVNEDQLNVLYDFINLSDSVSLESIGHDIFNLGNQAWKEGNLIALDMSGFGIDSIPTTIGTLKYLRQFQADQNNIMYLPSEIGDLDSLRVLHLRENQLLILKDEVGDLNHLRHLTLWDNQLNELTSNLSNLTKLNYLDLDGNYFTDFPSVLFQLQSLDTLYLNNNQLSVIPNNIDEITTLKLLDFTRNQIQEIPSAIGSLTNLNQLSFWENQISQVPESIGNLINLRILDFETNELYDIPNFFENLQDLEWLYLSYNHLFCEDGGVNPDYFPSSLLELQNSNPNLNVFGLENQDCGYQILSPTSEHEITGTSGFRFLSSPVSGKIYADLLDELWTQGAEGSDLPESSPNIWTYENGWNAVADLNAQVLDPGKGILIYIFSDIDYDGDDDLPVTISVNEDSALQKFNNNWNNFSLGSEVSSREWNLLGNPYGLAIDVQNLLNQNQSYYSTIYIWNNQTLSYKTHNGISGDIYQGLVAPFEGFWIQTLNLDSSDFIFDYESMVVNSYGNSGRNNTSTPSDSMGYGLITFESEGYESSVYISFSESGDVNLDPADARRIIPMQPSTHLTSMIYESGKSLSINNLPFNLNNDVMYPLDVMMLEVMETGYETQEAEVDISYDLSQLPEGIILALRDNSTDEMMYLEGSSLETSLQSKGNFDYPSGHMSNYPELGESQFTLFVYGLLASLEEDIIPETYALSQAYPNPFNPSTVIGYDLPVDSYVQLDIYDITGRHVNSLIDGMVRAGKQEFTWTTNQLASGIYLVKLVTGGKTFNQKITYLK